MIGGVPKLMENLRRNINDENGNILSLAFLNWIGSVLSVPLLVVIIFKTKNKCVKLETSPVLFMHT